MNWGRLAAKNFAKTGPLDIFLRAPEELLKDENCKETWLSRPFKQATTQLTYTPSSGVHCQIPFVKAIGANDR
jgi:hypothetical protein